MKVRCLVIGCRAPAVDFTRQLLADGFPVDSVLTLHPGTAAQAHVPGYVDVGRELGLPTRYAATYGLNTDADHALLDDLDIDLAICAGWSRLLPPWFLEKTRLGVWGSHASMYRLPGGRGRAPIVWSILLGARSVRVHVFRYVAEADAGPMLDVDSVPVNSYDDVRTVQNRSRMMFNRIVARHRNSLLAGDARLVDVAGDPSSWFPKRTDNDGCIDWTWPSSGVHDFVRAMTTPYPGAWSRVSGIVQERVRILAGIPEPCPSKEVPGTVVAVMYDGTFLVACGDHTTYLVLRHDMRRSIRVGEQFCPVDVKNCDVALLEDR